MNMPTAPMPPQRPQRPAAAPPPRSRSQVDVGRLWSGGAATAVVAGLIALAGVLVSRWLFNIPLLSPEKDGAYGDAHTTEVVVLAAAAALVATALANLLLLSTPRPLAFFSWIIGLVTLLAVVLPFQTTAPLDAKVATAAVILVIGVAIGSLVNSVAARSVRLPGAPVARYEEPGDVPRSDIGY
jgi:hypothetical protein